MSEAKFTPGPWVVADENRDDLQHMSRFGCVVVYAEQDCGIHPIADCSCNRTCRLTDEQLANARLISSAPALYEACEAALRDYETINAAAKAAGLHAFTQVPEQLSAALKAARGE